MVLKKQPAVEEGPTIMPDYIFEDEPADILNTMLTLYFSSTIMRCMQGTLVTVYDYFLTALIIL